jgi:uncharacterized protein YjbJ (UPF0337 family)
MKDKAKKDAADKLKDDKKLRAEGKRDKAKGAAHDIGDLKDTARDMAKASGDRSR